MLGIVDLTKKRSTDDEAMFVTILRALSQAVSKIDIVYHHALLHNVMVNISYLVLQAVVMWGNGRQIEFVRDARILRRNFVIDLLSY
ncbi:hypothetical protein ZEAMMB73_Zm00001d050506 [Zea mays]|uniref:Uncharacterized protein n=1 Tax=Zea mays TaxID=4577 RepID=A0A1D6Q1Y8_MAIZE|nr:hypothetical protein ZEAMMB73_Zm00001d050506 [Zea mays]